MAENTPASKAETPGDVDDAQHQRPARRRCAARSPSDPPTADVNYTLDLLPDLDPRLTRSAHSRSPVEGG
ncbi:hypothetical protein Dimus_022903, partial [Dionaea muscipula]